MHRLISAAGLLLAVVVLGCSPSSNSTAGKPTQGSSSDASTATAGPGEITPANTRIEFVGKKKDGQHTGSFKQFGGKIEPITGDITASKITLEIAIDSMETDAEKLTGHLKSPDFFDAKKYPKATFVSTKIEAKKAGDWTHEITGDLTLHGVTKPITMPARVKENDSTLTLDSEFKLDRTDYGISFNPAQVDKIVEVKVSAKVARK